MKAHLTGWTPLQSGTIIITDDDDNEIAKMAIIGLSNLPNIREYIHRKEAVAKSVVIAINGYEGKIAIDV